MVPSPAREEAAPVALSLRVGAARQSRPLLAGTSLLVKLILARGCFTYTGKHCRAGGQPPNRSHSLWMQSLYPVPKPTPLFQPSSLLLELPIG